MDAADDCCEPGSPMALEDFHVWCRAMVEYAVAMRKMPDLLFADGYNQPQPLVVAWSVEGTRASVADFLGETLSAWTEETDASAVGICVPFGGTAPSALLLTIDESGALAARAYVQADEDEDKVERGSWRDAEVPQLPLADLQRTLAKNAGYREFAKWRCRRCESVCPGEADETPTPCDFCSSSEIELVPLSTPLTPPRPPWDEGLESAGAERLATPFVQTLFGIIRGRPQG